MTELHRVPHFRAGTAPVRRPAQQLAVTRTDLPAVVDTSELWEGPEHELRARLRDEARDGRVHPYGDEEPRPGLPKGWTRVRVYLTDQERVRTIKPRRRWVKPAAVLGGVASILTGVILLVKWVAGVIAAAAAGVSLGGVAAVAIVAALIVAAAGGTTVVTVITKVTVRRGWF